MGNLIDLTGQRFGRLVVLGREGNARIGKDGQYRPAWRCICDCGTECIVAGTNLRSGNTKSCGCLRKRGRPVKDLTGRRFGRLTVIRQTGVYRAPKARKSAAIWLCRCDCGTEIRARADQLRQGEVKSCGCLRDEVLAAARKRRWQQHDRP